MANFELRTLNGEFRTGNPAERVKVTEGILRETLDGWMNERAGSRHMRPAIWPDRGRAHDLPESRTRGAGAQRERAGTLRRRRPTVPTTMIPRMDQGKSKRTIITTLCMRRSSSVSAGLFPGKGHLDRILYQGETKAISLAKKTQSGDISRLCPLHEFRPGQLFAQLEFVDASLDYQVFSCFHGSFRLGSGWR